MVLNSTSPITIFGEFKFFKSAMFRVKYVNTIFSSNEMILNGNVNSVNGDRITVQIPDINAKSATIELSLNGGINYHFIKDYNVILRKTCLD
jgi:hypothetical protein